MKGIVLYNESFFTMKEDEILLKENISRILLTLPGERINNPFFGSKLRTFLFDLDVIMREEVESEIVNSITTWEPRVSIDAISTDAPDSKTFLIKLECTNNDTLEAFTFEQLLRL